MSNYEQATLHRMAQRTPEWYEIRKPNLTASNFGEWLTKKTATAHKARLTAICKVIAAKNNCEEPPRFETWAMGRGIALEDEACRTFATQAKKTVVPVGFAQSKLGSFGCSPDGLIPDENSGVEIKCPLPTTHIRYLIDGVLPKDYVPQVHGSMAVTGAKTWYFCSFCPGLPLFHVKVERDDYTEAILEGLTDFSDVLVGCEALLSEKEYVPSF